MKLFWRTDWTAEDNYAKDGVSDFQRLHDNLQYLSDELIAIFAIDPELIPLVFSGYRTLPFADVLNITEQNLDRVNVFQLGSWISKNVVWVADAPAPQWEDINRWEENGRLLEEAIDNVRKWLVFCGADNMTTACGQSRVWQQRFRRR